MARDALQVLLELPRVDASVLQALDRALFVDSNNSETKQRAALKAMLVASGKLPVPGHLAASGGTSSSKPSTTSTVLAGSEELQVALSDWRPVSNVTNMAEPRPRGVKCPDPGDGPGLLGLAAAETGP